MVASPDHMELLNLAVLLRGTGDRNPFDIKNVKSPHDFPKDQRAFLVIDGVMHQFQYSLDILSEDKLMSHVSFSRQDMQVPEAGLQERVKRAFFPDPDEREKVITFPGVMFHVIHFAIVRPKQ